MALQVTNRVDRLDFGCYCAVTIRVVRLFENLVLHHRSKHIEIRYHFIRDKVQKGVLWFYSIFQQISKLLIF